MYWLVVNKTTRPQATGPRGERLVPDNVTEFQFVGIFRADHAEDACKAGARKLGSVGTYFAVEGTPWGVDMIEVEGVTELGEPETGDEQERRLRALERSVLDRDDLPA